MTIWPALETFGAFWSPFESILDLFSLPTDPF